MFSLTTSVQTQDNILHGRFLAELTKEVLLDLETSKYQHAEYRISIYGRKQVEWDILAAWYCQNELYSDNVLWLIQVWLLPTLARPCIGCCAQQSASKWQASAKVHSCGITRSAANVMV